jgi:hypothetical protein
MREVPAATYNEYRGQAAGEWLRTDRVEQLGDWT